MVGYYADVEFHGELRQDQYPDVCEGASIGYYNEHGKVLRLSNHIDAATYADALQKANTWVEGLRAVTEFVSAGILTGPEKMTVESAASRSRDWDLLGTGEVAHRLGVSTARVRQLLTERPDFPRPVSELAGAKIWRRTDVEEFIGQGWPPAPGRPSKTSRS